MVQHLKTAVVAAVVSTVVAVPASFAATRAFFAGVDVVSDDTTRTALGVRGHESASGTTKISHEPSVPGALDPNASVLSLRAEGATATQGIFFDAPLGSSGKILNLRNSGREVLVLRADGTLELHGRLVTVP
jgi:hypothetical protein